MARNKYPEQTVSLILETALMLFVENGYEDTSIQHIIDNLGGLSKGAIYHHFKSKEEIFDAVCKKIGNENTIYYSKIRDDKNKTGFEKLKTMINGGYESPNSNAVAAMKTKIMSDPKFMISQIHFIYDVIVPHYIRPVIDAGIQDGSIRTQFPKELGEVIITLMNVWINPMITHSSAKEMKQKLHFFQHLLRSIDVDILEDNTIKQYMKLFEQYSP